MLYYIRDDVERFLGYIEWICILFCYTEIVGCLDPVKIGMGCCAHKIGKYIEIFLSNLKII